jgi:hypothetical protein
MNRFRESQNYKKFFGEDVHSHSHSHFRVGGACPLRRESYAEHPIDREQVSEEPIPLYNSFAITSREDYAYGEST